VTVPQIFARARGPAAALTHEIYSAHYGVLIGYAFVGIVIESKTCRNYKAVLQTI
jgi:hypothetical protein